MVLKDAAAASIYGADGANGVILITTKKGKKENKIGFSTNWESQPLILNI
jgi:TonB-dependent SusC/RagA subfamily outer membrane receptor